MTGITSIGAYVLMYRLDRQEIGRMWRTKGSAAEKATERAGTKVEEIAMQNLHSL